MAQNISLWGASYSNVPAVDLPKTGGGTARFLDTNLDEYDLPITASDVRSGKTGFVNGSKIDGTMSSKSAATYTPGTTDQTIAAGQYLSGAQTILGDADLVAGNIKSGVEIFGVTGSYAGGSLATAVTGTFTPGTAGAVESVTIPYSGSGYPIVCTVFPADGSYKSSTPIYNLVQRYVVVEWFMTKGNTAVSPTYTTSGGANYGCTAWVYKSDASSATTYSRSSGMTTNTFSSSDPTAAGATVVRFSGNKTMKYMVANTSYGLAKDVEYRYVILYSA